MDHPKRITLAEFSKHLLRPSSAPLVERMDDGEVAPAQDPPENGFAAHVVLGLLKSHG
jgi:hypothetical protein